MWIVNLLLKLFGISWRIGTEKAKDETIQEQQQEIVDLAVENIENDAEDAREAVIDQYEEEKQEVSADVQARLDWLKGRNSS